MSCMVTRPQGFCSQPEKAIFTLRPKSWVSGWPIEKLGGSLGVRRRVEGFFMADARQRARRHVAHDVAASFLGRDADGGEPAHQRRGVVDVHIVKLKILARRHMGDAVGVLFGKIGQGLELLRRHAAEGNLDAHHARRIPERIRSFDHIGGEFELLHALAVMALAVVVALAVDAAAQSGFGENFLIDLALLAQLHLLLEDIDLAAELGGNFVAKFFFPG